MKDYADLSPAEQAHNIWCNIARKLDMWTWERRWPFPYRAMIEFGTLIVKIGPAEALGILKERATDA